MYPICGTGECSKELEQWCSSVKPGEGRLAKCMTDQLADEAKPGYKNAKSSTECAAELAAFKVDRADNINRDIPLAVACKSDAEKLCADKYEVGRQIPIRAAPSSALMSGSCMFCCSSPSGGLLQRVFWRCLAWGNCKQLLGREGPPRVPQDLP